MNAQEAFESMEHDDQVYILVNTLGCYYDEEFDEHEALESLLKYPAMEMVSNFLNTKRITYTNFDDETKEICCKSDLQQNEFWRNIGTAIRISHHLDGITQIRTKYETYFQDCAQLVSDLSLIYSRFLHSDRRVLAVDINETIREMYLRCSRHDTNCPVRPFQVYQIILDIANYKSTLEVLYPELFIGPKPIDDEQRRLDIEVKKKQFVKDLEKNHHVLDQEYKAKMSCAGTEGIVYYETEDEDFMELFDAMEATTTNDGSQAKRNNNRKRSQAIKNAKDKSYGAYKKYKNQEQNIDNQVTKLAATIKKMVTGDKRTEIIEGKKYTVLGIVKKILRTVALFSFNPLVGVLGTLVLYANDKRVTMRERKVILSELRTELDIINEKIDDAKSAGDRKAKYALMRSKAELERAISRIQIDKEADTKALQTAKFFANPSNRM